MCFLVIFTADIFNSSDSFVCVAQPVLSLSSLHFCLACVYICGVAGAVLGELKAY